MTHAIRIAVVSLALASGIASAQADSLLDQLAAQGQIVSTHGIGGR